MDITVKTYKAEDHERWDRFVEQARNSTFLLKRSFMDYHSDRFTDASLLFERGKRIVALLPANYNPTDHTVYSHQGLTYGGLIIGRNTTAKDTLECFDLLSTHYREREADRLVYKPLPHIYESYPSEEPLYALFRHGATLRSRGISSCIWLADRISFIESRKSGLRKAIRNKLFVSESQEENDVKAFHDILSQCLEERHGTQPVHTVQEMMLLMQRFPTNIRLFLTRNPEGRILAGAWVFDCKHVVHTQYLAASPEGKQMGALDLIISTLITDTFQQHTYLDFGISTENGGQILNEGLIFQKEGFGGRGVCYDAWEMQL